MVMMMGLHPTGTVWYRTWTRTSATELVLKGSRITFQYGFSCRLDFHGMHRSVMTALTATFGSTSGAGGKTLTVQL
jgi:hypothetical protein